MANKNPVHKFQKGIITNPKGRPKGAFSITTEIRRMLLTFPKSEKDKPIKERRRYLDLFVLRILDKAIGDGNEQMLKLVYNYMEGMPIQKISGDPDNPLIVQFSKQDEQL